MDKTHKDQTLEEFKETLDCIADDKESLIELTVAEKELLEKSKDIVRRYRELENSGFTDEQVEEKKAELSDEYWKARNDNMQVQVDLLKKANERLKTRLSEQKKRNLALRQEMHLPVRNRDKEELGHKVYPNDPCPCGSGKKYKKCCGR